MRDEWIDDEPGLHAALAELRRVVRRAFARRWLCLALALVGAGAVVAWRALPTRRYQSRVVYRVIEGGEADAAMPNRALRDYVRDDVFSNQALAELITRHHFVEHPTSEQVKAFRDEALLVEVWRSELGEGVDAAEQSARIAIGFSHRDPKVAYEVVCDLMDLVSGRADNAEVLAAQRELGRLDAQAERARDELARTRANLTLEELAARRAPPRERPQRLLHLEELRASVSTQEPRVAELQQQLAAARLHAQVLQKREARRFTVIVPPRPEAIATRNPRLLAGIGALAFLALLPLVGLAVGAWDQRVFDVADLRRLGIEPLGHVPGFPGDEAGSLDERRSRLRYTQSE